jgi:hypothetical protein
MDTESNLQLRNASRRNSFEPRWPVVLVVAGVIALLTILRTRIVLMPDWFLYCLGGALLLPTVGVWLSSGHRRWVRIERTVTLVLCSLTEVMTLGTVGYLVCQMVIHPAGIEGRQLLTSSVASWVINIMVFSLLYWQIDRGGPERRLSDSGPKPDWLFPQTGAPEQAPDDWRPTYVDYLHLSFSTATAFSTTEVAPMTSRAKLMMMFEGGVSLVTLVVVASRAINIIGS